MSQELMDSHAAPSLEKQLTAALDWWREAGVENDYADVARKLLEDAPTEKPQKAPKGTEKPQKAPDPPRNDIGGDREHWPQSLEGFAHFWSSEPSLDEGRVDRRVTPRGVHAAELMVLVPMPEADDSDTLLSATQGKLVANMLRAMEISPDQSYIASALPRHMPLADWQGIHTAGLGKVIAHHIALAAPKRLLVLGGDILLLLGLEKRRGVLEFTVGDTAIHLLASFAPENLLENARLRADLWRRWLDWTEQA